MYNFKRIVAVALQSALVLAFAVGCSKSDSKKAEKVEGDFNSLAAQMNSKGSPSTSWSDAELDEYERICLVMQQKLSEARSLNDRGDVYFDEGVIARNEQAVSKNLSAVREARARKQAARDQAKPRPETSGERSWDSSAEARFQSMLLERINLTEDLGKELELFNGAIQSKNLRYDTQPLENVVRKLEAHDRKLLAHLDIPGCPYQETKMSIQDFAPTLERVSRTVEAYKDISGSGGSDLEPIQLDAVLPALAI